MCTKIGGNFQVFACPLGPLAKLPACGRRSPFFSCRTQTTSVAAARGACGAGGAGGKKRRMSTANKWIELTTESTVEVQLGPHLGVGQGRLDARGAARTCTRMCGASPTRSTSRWTHKDIVELLPGGQLRALGSWYAERPITNVPSERVFAIMHSCEGHLRHMLTEENMTTEVSTPRAARLHFMAVGGALVQNFKFFPCFRWRWTLALFSANASLRLQPQRYLNVSYLCTYCC